ncbi:tyrosine-protein kinase family protein [Bacteroides sp. An51A]|uniref:GumC family protein n=1 Tax=Bacteroides sp. An51A TaxID=1965640 RepID=UPI000B36E402|nr:tyrosine-protein kinase family protein [Bacteroides sp. An51A]
MRTTNKLEKKKGSESLYATFFKYLSYWPWFVASVCFFCAAMFLFICYVAPVYKISSAVLIKVADQNQYQGMGENMAIGQDFGLFSMTSNFENELEVLQSRTLIQKVVCDLGLYIDIREKGLLGDKPLYKDTPINIYLTPQEADKLESELELDVEYQQDGKLHVKVEYEYTDKYGDEQELEEERTFDSLPAIYPARFGTISFTRNDSVEILSEDGSVHLVAYINTPFGVANSYKKDYLEIKPASKTTTIAKLSFKNTVKARGIDFVNRLIQNYNEDANDEKNEVAQKSAEFIEERLVIIDQELSQTETQLVDFKQQSGLTDLTNDTQLALQESSKYEQQRLANATQIRLVNYLKEYITNPKNQNEVIPINIGLEDADLNTVIGRYNDLLMERKRLLRTSSENNPAIININASIETMKNNVQISVNNVLHGLQITQDDLDRQARKFESRISRVPQNEKDFLNISRQQEIKASLYTMLLQKREENAITLASTATNGRIIENAAAGKKPVFPLKLIFMAAAFLFGLGVPAGIIYLRDLLKYKIEDSEDVENQIKVPLYEIPFEKQKQFGGIAIRKDRNDIIEEAFRILRTNLLMTLGDTGKIVIVTSTMPNEGKSFIAGNLAVSLSFLKKKVIVVGMDLRKPGLNKLFDLPRQTKGLTDYLEDMEHKSLSDLIQKSDKIEGLDILTAGSIPPSPTELLEKRTFESALAQLKEKYDYVILDTAPIGMVADTTIIARYADCGIYVCRMDYTPKNSLDNIHILENQCGLSKLLCVVNAINLGDRKHGYAYKYGSRYGYHYGYGKYK